MTKMCQNRSGGFLCCVCLILVLFSVGWNAEADSFWGGGTGDFNVAASWNPTGVPNGVNAINDSGSNNIVLVQSGDPVWNPWDIRAGDGAGTSGAFRQTGSTNNVNGWFRLGGNPGSFGSYILSNGTVNASLQAHVGEAGSGFLGIYGGTFNVGQNPLCIGDGDFGAGGSGILEMAGGTLNTGLGVDVWLGEGHNGGSGGSGTMKVRGGVVNIGGWFAIGRFGGTGRLELSGGSIKLLPGNNGNITLATYPGTGEVNHTGGVLMNTVSETWVAESSQGIWTLSGGTELLGTVFLTRLSGASGIFNLNGGDLFATQILDAGGNGTFNFNGGTLHARGDSANFLQAMHGINVRPGGARIHSEGHDITINGAFTDAGGGLVKLGAGSLTLSGNLLCPAATTVSAGTLIVSAPNAFASTNCIVAAHAGFGVALEQANAGVSVPELNLVGPDSALTLDFAGVGGQSIAPLQVGEFKVNGTAILNVAGFDFSTGQFPLVQYNSISGNGGFVLGAIPAGMIAHLTTNTVSHSIDLVVTTAPVNSGWQPKTAPLMTDWAQQVDPENVLPEYPRPQMVRSNWLNLNGVWQFQPGNANDSAPVGANLTKRILVPFPMESALSGVMQYHPYSWYRREFTVPPDWNGQRILLHFEAVNWRSQIFVNGQNLGTHTGGYDPFSYDITDYLNGSGPQELIVGVYSPQDAGGQPRGKQTLYPQGIMFTSASGIWQPVWLEPVPSTRIADLHIVPDIDANRVKLNVSVNGAATGLSIRATAFEGTNQISSATGTPGNNFYLNVPAPKLWSPTNPFLYDLQISLITNGATLDSVASYFGMRKISLGTKDGFVRLFLNNQFTFQFGPLDQGFWPDGIYTAPTDLALKSDLEMTKALGFNMVRKHIKVEAQRWYYWADKLGLLVWQDMPSGNSYTMNPSPPPVDAKEFIGELTAMVTNHWNSPSIVMWVVFNEGQGQAGGSGGVGQTNTAYLVSLVKSLDPSRLVNQASGWNYAGAGDVLDQHHYPEAQCPISSSQAVVCGEFGGVWSGIQNHTWSPGSGEVTPAQAAGSVASGFENLADDLANLIQERGMSAAVYTEISDVEIELAGLRTYDRKILKPDLHRMQAAITAPLAQYSYSAVIPDSRAAGQNWKYTFTTPPNNWFATGFNDSQWSSGAGGFGSAGAPNLIVRTTWNASDIWLRRTFNPGALTPQQITNLVFSIYHDEDCELYINGVLAASTAGYLASYGHLNIRPAALNTILTNSANVLAVHCHQTGGGQGIDVGIDLKTMTVPPPAAFIPNWLENGTGLAAEYFSETNFASPVFTRIDANLNFNWNNSSPGSGLTKGHFAVRWTGEIQPRYSEGYTFHFTGAGNCRLWIDGQQIINRSTPNKELTGSIALIGGQQVDLRLEYEAADALAGAVLEWDSASQKREIVSKGVLFPANRPPVLTTVPNFTLTAGQTLFVTNSATDPDSPAQMLSWKFLTAPTNAIIDPETGLISWRPLLSQSPSTQLFSVSVSDNGTPPMNAAGNFSVTVLRPLTPSFSFPQISGNEFRTSITGSPGPDYQIFSSTNLAGEWQLLMVTNPSSMPFLFSDPESTHFSQRFYRIQLGP